MTALDTLSQEGSCNVNAKEWLGDIALHNAARYGKLPFSAARWSAVLPSLDEYKT